MDNYKRKCPYIVRWTRPDGKVMEEYFFSEQSARWFMARLRNIFYYSPTLINVKEFIK